MLSSLFIVAAALTTLGLAAPKVPLTPPGGFMDTCRICSLGSNSREGAWDPPMGGYTLRAICHTHTDYFRDHISTQINLDRCLGNKNGTIIVKDGGNLSWSQNGCRQCQLREGGLIECDCIAHPANTNMTSGPGQWLVKHSVFDLNAVLSNHEGRLSCHGHVGEEISDCTKENYYERHPI